MRRDRLLVILLVTIFAVGASWPVGADTRIALVIGNSGYPSGPLASPREDAKAVERKLITLGFQVTRKTDLGRDGFFDAIRDFGERLQWAGTVGLFYYSGHGMQVNNRNYMIPTDADIRSDLDVARFAVPVDDVLTRMEVGRSNPNFVILDACRNNPFEKRFKSPQDGLAQMDAPPSTLIVFAAAPGRVAEAGFGGQMSLYTEALIENIDRPFPNSLSMFQAVQNAVYERSGRKQSPRLELPPGLPDFSFRPMGVSISRPAIEAPLAPIPVSPAVTSAPAQTKVTDCRDFLVFFEFSQPNQVSAEARKIYESAAAAFKACGAKKMIIAGHTDRVGNALQNLRLSQERALAVKDYFSSKFGFPRDAMVAVGYGESHPLVPTDDGVEEPQNRRIVIHFGNEQDADIAMQEERELKELSSPTRY